MANPSPSFLLSAVTRPDAPIDSLGVQARAALTGNPGAWRGVLETLASLSVNLIIAAVILLATLWASGWLSGVVRRAFGRLHAPNAPDRTLQGFMSSLTRWFVIVIGLIAVLQELGVQTTSILAVLGAASLAIGLALQGALTNVAAGVMILILRPYRIGDVVEINGRIGTVQRLDLFMTELADPDNVDVYVPNGKAFGEIIVNYTRRPNRRMELHFSVDYDDDVDTALAYLVDAAKADPRVLAEPRCWAGVTALEQNSVTVTLRAWAATPVYWDVRYDLLKRVKQAFDAGGLRTPYPHQIAMEKPPRPQAGPAAPPDNPAASEPSQDHT